jgi:glycerol kinase
MAGDQQSALFGQACFSAGMAKNTYGTGCFMLMHTGAQFQTSRNGLLTTSAAQTDAQPAFALEGSVFVGGAGVQWLRDGLGAIRSSAEVQALADTVPDSGGVMLVPAFTGLGAPYWNPQARGTMTGLTRGSTLAHIARAALESIAFQSAALLQAMARDAQQAGAAAVTELRVDGGACINDLLMQFQADLLGIPVLRPAVGGQTTLEVPGTTIGEVLANLVAAHPTLEGQVLDAEGGLHRFLNIYVNDDDVRYIGGLNAPVADGDDITLLPAVAGGVA